MTTRHPYWVLCTVGAAALLSTGTAFADNTAATGEFSVQRFEPAPGSKNYLSVEGVRMAGNWGWTAGLMFNYARNPFVVQSCKSQSDCSAPNPTQQSDTSVVRDLMWWDLMASVSPISRLQVGFRLPLAYANGDGAPNPGGTQDAIKKFGVGDPMLEAKFRVFGDTTSPVALGVGGDVSFPAGHGSANGSYIGNQSPVTGGLRAIFDGAAGPLQFGLNLRALFRESATLGSTTIGNEFRYGAGLGYRISPIFRVLAEGYGSTKFSAKIGTNSLEIDGAVEIQPLGSNLNFRLGGGAGVLSGAGVPAGRVIAGIGYYHEVGDKDGDGINDNDDKCPTIPEDKDGFEDDDGCPDEDNDKDSIPDAKDKCPNQPETVNSFQDEDGCPDDIPDRDKDGIADGEDMCPDEGGKSVIRAKGPYYGCPDRDGDGVPDKIDKCPDQPEDTDGFEDLDGCPDPDNDHDGIPDDQDECIDQPETINGYKDEDGCPDVAPDRDHDGIPDAMDKCPDTPENYNGFQDEDGCPDTGPSLVHVGAGEIKILQKVEFATASDKITGAKSFQVLDAVVGALKGHSEIMLLEIGGHTDNAGDAAGNKALSQKRAEAVVKYLVDKGTNPSRLQAKGYGQEKPIADNKSAAGKQKNRRVEFLILQTAKGNGAAPAAGAPAAAAPAAPAAPAAAPAKAAPAAPAKKEPGKVNKEGVIEF
jgi:outer membrane protein OmpA-like peptidoglycan-associated protein